MARARTKHSCSPSRSLSARADRGPALCSTGRSHLASRPDRSAFQSCCRHRKRGAIRSVPVLCQEDERERRPAGVQRSQRDERDAAPDCDTEDRRRRRGESGLNPICSRQKLRLGPLLTGSTTRHRTPVPADPVALQSVQQADSSQGRLWCVQSSLCRAPLIDAQSARSSSGCATWAFSVSCAR